MDQKSNSNPTSSSTTYNASTVDTILETMNQSFKDLTNLSDLSTLSDISLPSTISAIVRPDAPFPPDPSYIQIEALGKYLQTMVATKQQSSLFSDSVNLQQNPQKMSFQDQAFQTQSSLSIAELLTADTLSNVESLKVDPKDSHWKEVLSQKGNNSKYGQSMIGFENLTWFEMIGQGMFGQVYRVFDKASRKFFAVKEISPSTYGDDNNILKVAQLEMLNLTKLSNFTQDSDKFLQIYSNQFSPAKNMFRSVMEIGKSTLQDIANFRHQNEIRWTQTELRQVIYHLTDQVMSLDELGVHHRDVKPANIIWTYQNKIKLADFGCAHIQDRDALKESVPNGGNGNHKTPTADFIAGTPYFMSQELAEAYEESQKSKISKEKRSFDLLACDLYSVGMTMLHLIERRLNRKKIDLFLQTGLQDAVPGLYTILKGLLSEDVKTRKLTAKKILEDKQPDFELGKEEEDNLRRFQYQKIISSQQVDPELYCDMFVIDDAKWVLQMLIDEYGDQDFHQYVERVLALIKALMKGQTYAEASTKINELSNHPRFCTLDQSTEGKQLLAKVVSTSAEIFFHEAKYFDAVKIIPKAIKIYTEDLKIQSSIELIKAYDLQGSALRCIGQYAKGNDDWEKSLLLECGEAQSKAPNKIEVWRIVGIGFVELDILKKLHVEYQKQIEQAHNLSSPEYAWTHLKLAVVQFRLDQEKNGIQNYEKGLEILKGYYGENSVEAMEYLLVFGMVIQFIGYPELSLEALDRSDDILKNRVGSSNSDGSFLFAKFSNQMNRGMIKQNIPFLEGTIQYLQHVGGPKSVQQLFFLLKKCEVGFFFEEPDTIIKAADLIDEIIQDDKEENELLGTAMITKSMAMAIKGEFKEAQELLDNQKLKLNRILGDKEYVSNVFISMSQGYIYWKQNKIEEAISAFLKGREQRNDWFAKRMAYLDCNILTPFIEVMLGRIYQGLGQNEKAIKEYDSILENCDKAKSEDHFMKGVAYVQKGKILKNKELVERGIKFLEENAGDDNHYVKDGREILLKLEE